MLKVLVIYNNAYNLSLFILVKVFCTYLHTYSKLVFMHSSYQLLKFCAKKVNLSKFGNTTCT